jgi:hypothetical protein
LIAGGDTNWATMYIIRALSNLGFHRPLSYHDH